MTPSESREAPLQRLTSFLTAKVDMLCKRILLANLKIASRDSLVRLGGWLLSLSLGLLLGGRAKRQVATWSTVEDHYLQLPILVFRLM